MASVTKNEIPEIANFMGDFWTFIKSHWSVEPDNLDYWDGVVEDADKIYKKYNNDKFIKAVLISTIGYFDEKGKEEKENGK